MGEQSPHSAQAEQVTQLLRESIEVKQRVLREHVGTVVRMASAIVKSLRRGGKLLLCGNGGSAADAQHLAAELLVRLRPHVNRDGIAALALATDMSSLTGCGNDFSFEAFYERMVLTLGKPGDVLLGITTSGKSPNVVRALRAARKMKMTTLGLLGCSGMPALKECDIALVVPSDITGRIQESHIAIGHALMELTEDALLRARKGTRARRDP